MMMGHEVFMVAFMGLTLINCFVLALMFGMSQLTVILSFFATAFEVIMYLGTMASWLFPVVIAFVFIMAASPSIIRAIKRRGRAR